MIDFMFAELLNFDEFGSEGENLEFSKFNAERNIINGLDLMPFPVTIKSISFTQTCVLRVLRKPT